MFRSFCLHTCTLYEFRNYVHYSAGIDRCLIKGTVIFAIYNTIAWTETVLRRTIFTNGEIIRRSHPGIGEIIRRSRVGIDRWLIIKGTVIFAIYNSIVRIEIEFRRTFFTLAARTHTGFRRTFFTCAAVSEIEITEISVRTGICKTKSDIDTSEIICRSRVGI